MISQECIVNQELKSAIGLFISLTSSSPSRTQSEFQSSLKSSAEQKDINTRQIIQLA